jgi:Rps23 Pro-64 3,4-dihydroxylase Tpa1-like proline 4-hydroxylase
MELYQMIDIDLITNKYDPKDYAIDYSHGVPVPWLYFDDFLPRELLEAVQQDIENIPKHLWSNFTRNGSNMKECNNMRYSPLIRDLVLNLNSGEFLGWLENITGIKKLIPDPLLIGAGLMRCYNGDSLKLHTDFNWNEQLHLNRSLSAILYLGKDWDPTWGGNLEFWDFDRTKCLHRIEPRPNRLLLWNYDERLVHGHPNPITCPPDASRDGLRLFYFTSNASPLSPPHRSLYWFDDAGPHDQKENK